MKRLLLLPFAIFCSFNLGYSQILSPADIGFEAYQMDDPLLGKVNYYLSKSKTDNKKPLLVYLDGSGPDPFFQKTEGGIASTIVLDFQRLSTDYRILLISKPGVPFMDEANADIVGSPRYQAPEEYTKRLSLGWRTDSADKIIQKLVEQSEIDAKRVIVLGFSEGAQVGPFLAEKNKHVSHLLLFGGNGLNQFFDPIISTRLQAQNGQISEEEAQVIIDSLFVAYQDIYENPNQTDQHWWGHSYKRWSSFTERDPLEALIALDIPIYMANGSLDENSVLSADYIKLEFIKRKKNNLYYKTYPNHDHQFNELIFENATFKEAIPRLDLVMKAAMDWLTEQ